MTESTKKPAEATEMSTADSTRYEAPHVERVLTKEMLEAEVLYAGQPTAPR
jgi:hypothetical protein